MRVAERVRFHVLVETTTGQRLASRTVATALAAQLNAAEAERQAREMGHDWRVRVVVDRRPLVTG